MNEFRLTEQREDKGLRWFGRLRRRDARYIVKWMLWMIPRLLAVEAVEGAARRENKGKTREEAYGSGEADMREVGVMEEDVEDRMGSKHIERRTKIRRTGSRRGRGKRRTGTKTGRRRRRTRTRRGGTRRTGRRRKRRQGAGVLS